MPIFDRVIKYSVSVFRRSAQPGLPSSTRQIRLTLESGGTASIDFTPTLPSNFLQFSGSATALFMTTDQFADVYEVLRGESPVFFTALDLGIRIGSVHTELDLSIGETPGEGDQDPQSLQALIRRARREGTDRLTPSKVPARARVAKRTRSRRPKPQ
jgi:hypothetical protein